MKNRLLTLGDLYEYFEKQGKDVSFGLSEDNKVTFAVQIPGKAVFEDTGADGLTKCHIKACHTQDNKNHIFFADDVMNDALSSFKTRPILANIREVDGQLEFGGHDFTEEKDLDTGEVKRIYKEIPIGVTSSIDEPYMEYDAEKDKTYVHVNGYLFDDYNEAKSIIEREGGSSDVSMEINIEQLSYNAVKHSMDVQKFRNTGITVLGVTEDGDEIDPAMVGADITLADFEVDEKSSAYFNAVDSKRFVEAVDKLEKLVATFSNTKSEGKEVNESDMNKFEELLAKYGKTAEDITFEYAELSDEELEAKFAELFDEGAGDGGDDSAGDDTADDNNAGGDDDSSDDNTDEDSDDGADDNAPMLGSSGGDDSDDGTSDDVSSKKKIYSITDPSGETFSVSLNDKITAVSQLVNATYAEDDNDYYFCTVFEDYVVMESWYTARYFKQSFTEENGEFSLTGDRVEVFTEFLTAEEQNTLKAIRGEYAELKEYKESNEAAKFAAAREEIIAKFSEVLNGNNEFEELKNSEFSAEELELRCNALVGAQQMATFSTTEEKKPHKVLFDFNGTGEEKKPYGGLFDEMK